MKLCALWNSAAQKMKYTESCLKKKNWHTSENMLFFSLFLMIHGVTGKKIGYVRNHLNWWGLAKVTVTPGFFQLFTEDGQMLTWVYVLYAWSFVPIEFGYIAESEMYLQFMWKANKPLLLRQFEALEHM